MSKDKDDKPGILDRLTGKADASEKPADKADQPAGKNAELAAASTGGGLAAQLTGAGGEDDPEGQKQKGTIISFAPPDEKVQANIDKQQKAVDEAKAKKKQAADKSKLGPGGRDLEAEKTMPKRRDIEEPGQAHVSGAPGPGQTSVHEGKEDHPEQREHY